MSVTIRKDDFLENTSQEKIDRINKEIPSKLASMFYISKTNRVSYYSTNSWGDLVVWNKGSLNWEHCPSMLDKELYTLPARHRRGRGIRSGPARPHACQPARQRGTPGAVHQPCSA